MRAYVHLINLSFLFFCNVPCEVRGVAGSEYNFIFFFVSPLSSQKYPIRFRTDFHFFFLEKKKSFVHRGAFIFF